MQRLLGWEWKNKAKFVFLFFFESNECDVDYVVLLAPLASTDYQPELS